MYRVHLLIKNMPNYKSSVVTMVLLFKKKGQLWPPNFRTSDLSSSLNHFNLLSFSVRYSDARFSVPEADVLCSSHRRSAERVHVVRPRICGWHWHRWAIFPLCLCESLWIKFRSRYSGPDSLSYMLRQTDDGR